MHPEARLTILFDCCHSGSACELPFVYRPDAEGNINMLDTFKKGVGLVRAAGDLLGGGLTRDKVDDAKMLLGGATDFFHSLRYGGSGGADDEGLAAESFQEDWHSEGKDVWMFSGCRDDQTSADATIAGAATGAMSWAFMKTMRENPEQSYENVSGLEVVERSGTNVSRCSKTRGPRWSRITRRCRNSAAEGATISTSPCLYVSPHLPSAMVKAKLTVAALMEDLGMAQSRIADATARNRLARPRIRVQWERAWAMQFGGKSSRRANPHS